MMFNSSRVIFNGFIMMFVLICSYIFLFSSFAFVEDFKAYLKSNVVFNQPENFEFQNRSQFDPDLINYIKTVIRRPSELPYNLTNPELKFNGPGDEAQIMGNLFGQVRRDGFFLECGGFDGELWSLTLYLERYLGFRGLLIEANPDNYQLLASKERKAYTLNAALSPTNTSSDLVFSGSKATGSLLVNANIPTFKVKAFPLYSILQALNVTFVDFFTLDIQGFEFRVLKTIPWDKMKIGVIIVEFTLDPEPKKEMLKYMEDRGYIKLLQNGDDFILAHKDYYKK